MVETQSLDKGKIHQLVDDINVEMKTKIPYPPEKQDFKELMLMLKKQFPDKINTVIFKTYILEKDNKKTEINLNRFYQITGKFRDPVVPSINKMITPHLKVGMDKIETIEIPTSILSSVKNAQFKDSLVHFEYQLMNVFLDYKSSTMEISFTGKLNQKAQLNSAKQFEYDPKSSNQKLVNIPNAHLQPVDFEELKFIVTPSGISLEALTPDQDRYQLFDNKWKTTKKKL